MVGKKRGILFLFFGLLDTSLHLGVIAVVCHHSAVVKQTLLFGQFFNSTTGKHPSQHPMKG